jgi:hypothetical protein
MVAQDWRIVAFTDRPTLPYGYHMMTMRCIGIVAGAASGIDHVPAQHRPGQGWLLSEEMK